MTLRPLFAAWLALAACSAIAILLVGEAVASVHGGRPATVNAALVAPAAAPMTAAPERILAGVHAGPVDLSELDAATAHARLAAAFASVGQGRILIRAGGLTATIPYSSVSRLVDVDATVADALAVGRTGSLARRLFDTARARSLGVLIAPPITFDATALGGQVSAIATLAATPSVDAMVVKTAGGFTTVPAVIGRQFDATAMVPAIGAELGSLDAPPQLDVSLPQTDLPPSVTDATARAARAAADAAAQPVVVASEGRTWTIPETAVHAWISFANGNGAVGMVLDARTITRSIAALAGSLNRPPVSASWDLGANGVVVIPSVNGRSLDLPRTEARVEALLRNRAAGKGSLGTKLGPTFAVARPKLTTQAAQAQASRFALLSSWTTVFDVGPHNGWGANIWIPAQAIDGQVVQPGATFSFWDAIGPVTLARGYTLGGAIVNGHTEEGVALGGGICSTSTTLFNAALRAGFAMGERSNHYYYISRYPVGLDATVSQSGSSVQNMTWTNDSPYPVLIKSFKGAGSVTFSLYGVVTGRQVFFSQPIITNYRPATSELLHTSALQTGVQVRVEYPDDGFDAVVTRTVTDASGKVIHQETYSSHYAMMTGLIMVGDLSAKNIPVPSYAPGAQHG